VSAELVLFIYLFPPVMLRTNAGHDLFILEVSKSPTRTHHSRQDSSGRVISSSQRPPPRTSGHCHRQINS